MIKPLTFEEYWNQFYKGITPNDPLHDLLKQCIKNTWNRTLLEAKIVCFNTLEKYKESAFVDLELVEDICKEIESLKSNN